jgi:signal transduction histidine kinase
VRRALWLAGLNSVGNHTSFERTREHHVSVRVRALMIGLLALGAGGVVAPILLASVGRLNMAAVAATGLPLVATYGTGAVVYVLRPDHASARLLGLVGSSSVIAFGASAILQAASPQAQTASGSWLLCVVAVLGANVALAGWLHLLASFPDGRLRDERVVLLVVRTGYALAVCSAVLTALHPRPEVPLAPSPPGPAIDSPLPHAVTEQFGRLPVLDSYLYLLVATGLIILVSRYPKASPEQRLQMRWPLAATAFVLVVVLLSVLGALWFLPSEGTPAQIIWGCVLGTVPLSLAVGILRYRLFDLDLVVRRSVVYGVLWLCIAAAYAGLAGLLGLAAGAQVSVGVAVFVTIAAAMLFQPARVRLERLADRVVFGERVEGYALIRRLGSALESAVPAEELVPRLTSTVRQGMGADWVQVWTTSDDGNALQVAGAAGPVTGQSNAALSIDLCRGEQIVGRLDCGPRRHGEYTEADRELLESFANQAALALTVEHQARELAASRIRIVAAEAAERRRIERNIHDGVQQQLVSLMAGLSVAQTQLQTDPDAAARRLTSMQAEFRQTLADLRDLASGIHPPVLADRGLPAAVEALAARLPIGISVQCLDGTDAQRFDDPAEAAAYFCVAEAFTNAIKHGSASQATVQLSRLDGMLVVAIEDNGAGFDPASSPQRGLRGMRDRLEALGGALTVHSDETGTRVEVSVPATLRDGH